MGYQSTLLARNKLDPDIGHNVYRLTTHCIGPITPEPNRVHRVNLERRVARDHVYGVDGAGAAHHYLEYDDLGSTSLRL
jgi:hypothetical protein